MPRSAIGLVLLVPALACGAASPEGRWEGLVQIPGRELRVVVDLGPAAGAWTGSIIIPELDIKGAPLANIVATQSEVNFEVAKLLDTPTYGPARFKARLEANESMTGEMTQGGNAASFSMKRTGAAQVDAPPRSTAVGHALEDQWIGEFELGGYPRHVTVTLANHADGAATATFIVVGKQTTNLPVDLVVEEGSFLRIESRGNQVAFEGRFVEQTDEIRGTFELGTLELPLVLRRFARRAS